MDMVKQRMVEMEYTNDTRRLYYNTRTVQNVAGFASVKSVMVYQRMNDMQNVVSPLENIRKK